MQTSMMNHDFPFRGVQYILPKTVMAFPPLPTSLLVLFACDLFHFFFSHVLSACLISVADSSHLLELTQFGASFLFIPILLHPTLNFQYHYFGSIEVSHHNMPEFLLTRSLRYRMKFHVANQGNYRSSRQCSLQGH